MTYRIVSNRVVLFRGRESEALLQAAQEFRSNDRVEVWSDGRCVAVFIR